MSTETFLLEVGTEEVPARMMEGALDQLRERAEKWFTDNNYDDAVEGDPAITVNGTPRRFILEMQLPEKQPDETVTEKGPPEHVAYEDGEPTGALKGFCGQHDVSSDQVEIRDIDGGTYTVLELEKQGSPTVDRLEETIEPLVLEMDWPKRMRWESSNTEFIRPIRWAVAFYGEQPLDISLGPVETGTETRGLRFSDHERISVSDPDDFYASLRQAGVEFDQDARREEIVQSARELAEEEGGEAYLPDDLVDEVNHLVESPTPFLGRFDEDFLDLPAEVLEEAMIAHQKYFPVRSEGGLKPCFVGVRNGGEQELDTVRRGNEKVIRARLSDAVFFYEKDLERDYEDYRDDLDGVVFQDELGSLLEKTERLGQLADTLEFVPDDLSRVARHCKNDHVTEIVGEFPKLQGVMGRIYAKEAGWSHGHARTIEQHYKPAGRDDELPDSTSGQWLSVLDRIDTLVGFFGVGHRVTGSSDPYGLRRDALGLLRVAVFGDISLDLRELIDHTSAVYSDEVDLDADDTIGDLEEFLKDRLYFLFDEITDNSDDEITAVLERLWTTPDRAYQRLQWLSDWRGSDRFNDLYTTADRIGNITTGVEPEMPDTDLFEHAEEHDLWDYYQDEIDEIHGAIDCGDQEDVLDRLADLRSVTDAFFDEVMVMAEDETLQENRLRLLRTVRSPFDRIADFTEIEVERT